MGDSRDVGADAEAGRDLVEDRPDPVHRLLDVGIDVAFAERVRRCGQHPDAVDSRGHSRFQAAQVGHQATQKHTDAGHPGDHLGGVGHLRHGGGADEADRVEADEAGHRQIVDQADLGIGGDEDRATGARHEGSIL